MPLNVYYLDDEEALCENFVDFFASEQVRVTTFTEPAAALAAIELAPPDLLFLDYRLPSTTGDDLALTLDPALPKFLITGDISVKPRCAFERILSKPYSEREIVEILAQYGARKAAG